MLPVRNVPTTVVTGFLGTGKTTLILDAFRHRPEGERWAVLVNEFGEVGIDGALYGDLAVKEIPGGCICCTAGVALRFGLVELLRTQRPDRLFIEPTGLANPASILDLLRQPGIRDAVDPRATVALVDPRHLDDPRFTEHDAWAAQVAIADVLVGTFASRTPDLDGRFATFAAELWPPKLQVVRSDGTFDPAWLELDPYPREVAPTHGHGAQGAGWVFPRDHVFDLEALTEALQDLLRPGPVAPDGLVRLKGIFRVAGRWLLFQGTSDRLEVAPVLWRRDSRVDLVGLSPFAAQAARDRIEQARTHP
ncbi:MAG: GTP-binding protein, partial [Myxococcales bacterium]|nr:GTP-binding protein [Myxococcales bacterium]